MAYVVANRDLVMERLGETIDFGADVFERLFFAFGEGIGGIAIGAAQVAGGETDEDARQAGKSAFALQAQIDLVDDECVGHLALV